MTEFEQQCYGCTEAALRATMKQVSDHVMLAAGMMSDAQEVLSGEFGEPDTETARQFINRAKFVLFNMEEVRV